MQEDVASSFNIIMIIYEWKCNDALLLHSLFYICFSLILVPIVFLCFMLYVICMHLYIKKNSR